MIRTALPLLAACLLPGLSGAEIYRHVGPDGSVHFTDSPPEDADVERIDLPPVNTIRSETGASRAAAAQPEPGPQQYRSLQLSSSLGTTVTNPTTALAVTARPDIPLQPRHVLVFQVNGQEVPAAGGMTVMLADPARGQHVFVAEVRDDKGRPLIRSAPLTIQVHRTSIPPARVTPR